MASLYSYCRKCLKYYMKKLGYCPFCIAKEARKKKDI